MASLLNARQLIAAGLCTAMCLVSATRTSTCNCVCRAAYHGALADTPVPGSNEARLVPTEPYDGQEDGLVHMCLSSEERRVLRLPTVDEEDGR